jgi:large subunit ribosomal protein L3
VREFRTPDAADFEVGKAIGVEIVEVGQKVHVAGRSKGRGFAGSMKRHRFRGQPGSHGCHKKHRAPGSVGASATPARVFKGTRLPGHMGSRRTTVRNLEVIQVVPEQHLLLLRGAVPGPKGGLVEVHPVA